MTIAINGMAHVILTVSRFEIAREFYRKLLPEFGMKVAKRSRLRLGLFVWCGLPVAGQGGGADHASLQYRCDEPSSRRDQ